MAEFHRGLPGFPYRRLAALALAAFVVPWDAGEARADTTAAGSASAAASPSLPARVLAPLPEVPKITLPEPSASDLEDLDALLERLRSEDASTRDTAAREVLEAKPSWVSAIKKRLDAIADKANRDDMRRVLESVRKKGRASEREKLEQSGKRGKVDTPDYLRMLVEHAEPKSKAWQDIASVTALERMLAQIGSIEAGRELIEVYTRFGEFLRVDVQLQLAKMGDKAVAPLIEARRHKAEKVAKWAVRELDALGKAIPSEAVQTEDHQVLADVLRAYGRVRDPDAARIVISFANTERAQVREAARQAVAMMGDVANWQLRDSYEDILGKKPPRDWTWDRTARELFGELDRQRLAQVYTLYDQGEKARAAGKLDEMGAAYDKVLARSPLFERREEMAKGYVELAKQKLDDDRPKALAALRRAERLTSDAEDKKHIESLALTLEGEELAGRGVADQVLFNRALELDPANSRAKDALGRLQRGETKKKSAFERFAVAGAIGFGALVAMLLIGLRRGKREDAVAEGSDMDRPNPEQESNEPAPTPSPKPTEPAPREGDTTEPAKAPPAPTEPAPPPDTTDPAPPPEQEDSTDPAPTVEEKPPKD